MKLFKYHPTNEDVENALVDGRFFSVQLAEGAEFDGRPWLFLSVFPELDECIRALNRLHAIATGIYLLPVLAFHAASGRPVVPFVHRPGTQQRLDLAPVSIAKITSILQAVAFGLAADLAHPEEVDAGVPEIARDANVAVHELRAAEVCAATPVEPTDVAQLLDRENAERIAASSNANKQSARAEMRSALESAAELGLSENDVTRAVETFAKNPQAGAKILLPDAEGTDVNVAIPQLELLRTKDPRPREMSREYCGYDASHDILILDGRIAIAECKKVWGQPPPIGEIVRVDAIREGKITLEKLSVRTDLKQQDLL